MSISGDYHVTDTSVSCDDHVIIMWHWGPTYLLYICTLGVLLSILYTPCSPMPILTKLCWGTRTKLRPESSCKKTEKFSKSTIHSRKFSWGSIFTDGQSFNYHFAIVYVQLSLFRRFNFWQLDGRPWKPQKLNPLKISHYIMVYTKG